VKNGHLVCYGIKKRWIGKPPEDWIDTYTMEPGSQGRSIFNYNRLISRRSWPYVVIVEGVLDCMLLDQLGIPAVAPFGGGGVWDPRWTHSLDRAREIVIVADDDEDGQGLVYAEKKRKMLGRGQVVFPPGGYKDIGEAYTGGENIPAWLKDIARGAFAA
jgi:DNA primase